VKGVYYRLGKKCFVLAPLGKEGSITRQRSDQIYEKIIQPALAACEYEGIRADKIPTSGVITTEIIEHLLNDELVIADLTERNPNVTYELGIRHAFRKPVIHMKDVSEKKLPFDVQGIRTIDIDYRFADKWEHYKNKLIQFIKNIDTDPTKLQSPIGLTAVIQSIGKNEAQSQFNSEVLTQLQIIKSSIFDLESVVYSQFGPPDQEPPDDEEPEEPPDDIPDHDEGPPDDEEQEEPPDESP